MDIPNDLSKPIHIASRANDIETAQYASRTIISPKEPLTEWQKLLIVSSWQKTPNQSPQALHNNNHNHSRSRSPISTGSRQSPIAYRHAPSTHRPRSAAATNNNSALPFLPSLIATAMQQIHTQRSRRSSASLLYMPTKLSDLSAAVLQIYPHLDLMLSPRGKLSACRMRAMD